MTRNREIYVLTAKYAHLILKEYFQGNCTLVKIGELCRLKNTYVVYLHISSSPSKITKDHTNDSKDEKVCSYTPARYKNLTTVYILNVRYE